MIGNLNHKSNNFHRRIKSKGCLVLVVKLEDIELDHDAIIRQFEPCLTAVYVFTLVVPGLVV